MDNLDWEENPPTVPNEVTIPPCMWSSRQNEIGENLLQSSVDYGGLSGKVDLAEALFNSSIETCGARKFNRVSTELVEMLAPALDPMSGISAVEFSECQEALWPAESNELAKPELTGASWVDCSSPDPLSRPCPLGNDLIENFGLFNDQFQFLSNLRDGVSTIFSNCKNEPNLMSCSGNASSGESDNYGSGTNYHVSLGSSNPDASRSTHPGSAETRPSSKRKGETSLYCDVLQSDSSTLEGGFRIIFENPSKSKKPRSENQQRGSNIGLSQPENNAYEPDTEANAQVKEMIYRAAALRPVSLGSTQDEAGEKPKRKNVRISSDPQTVAARHRRERISKRLRVLQRMVPGGSKMDTASMLDEAANYLKFLKSQVGALETLGHNGLDSMNGDPFFPLFHQLFDQFLSMQTLFSHPANPSP